MKRSFGERMKGAALLHVDTYEEVEADASATPQAAGVVALVAAVAIAVVTAFVGWLIWALLTYLIGDKLLRGTATWGELLRTLGFAQTPRLLLVLAHVPTFGVPVQLVVFGWTLVTSVVAIRQALDFGTGRAILTGALGLVVVELLRIML
ncbi:MAG: YIP1 family protein [Gemmatimonadetes bacterium]|nr:YIP1 family protein [Gemmatimonadota bacterium]